MKKVTAVFICAVIVVLAPVMMLAKDGKEVHKEFSGIDRIDIGTVSGDVIIKVHGSDAVIVDLYYDIDGDEESFEYRFKERSGTLKIEEDWHGHNTSGEVVWTLAVPKGIDIEFSTASGDFEASGPFGSVEASTASGDIEITDTKGDVSISTASGEVTLVKAYGKNSISTASGDIEIRESSEKSRLSTASGEIKAVKMEGDLKFSTASGDIEVSDCKGTFKLSCASGTISVENVTFTGPSAFSAASGEVEVILAESCKYDLELSSASGDVTLDYNGHEIKGYFEFEAKIRGGRIKSPFGFDDEEEYKKHGQKYVRKSFTRNGDQPQIFLNTASGTATLKK